jgi:hypothetical protein
MRIVPIDEMHAAGDGGGSDVYVPLPCAWRRTTGPYPVRGVLARCGGVEGILHPPTRMFYAGGGIVRCDEEHARAASRVLGAMYTRTDIEDADALENVFHAILVLVSHLEVASFDLEDFVERIAPLAIALPRRGTPIETLCVKYALARPARTSACAVA